MKRTYFSLRSAMSLSSAAFCAAAGSTFSAAGSGLISSPGFICRMVASVRTGPPGPPASRLATSPPPHASSCTLPAVSMASGMLPGPAR